MSNVGHHEGLTHQTGLDVGTALGTTTQLLANTQALGLQAGHAEAGLAADCCPPQRQAGGPGQGAAEGRRALPR